MKSLKIIMLTLALLEGCIGDVCYEKKCPEGPCGPGHKFDWGNQNCVPCDEGTFINQSNHACTICDACFLADDHLQEVVLEECTPFKNSVIGCEGNFFFKNGTGCKKGGCYPCTICKITTPHTPYEVNKCGIFTDTLCSSIPIKMLPTSEEVTATPLPAGNDTERNHTENEKGNENLWKETVILAVTIPCGVVVIALVAIIWLYMRQQSKQRRQKSSALKVVYSPVPGSNM